MFILNLIKQHAQRRADNKRIANDARTDIQRTSTIANAPVVKISVKKAA